MYLGYVLYERAQNSGMESVSDNSAPSGSNQAPEVLSYPSEIYIARADGSSLDIRLMGRSATEIEFERLSDGATFTFGIDQLDLDSQTRVREYPVTGLTEIEDAQLAPTTVEVAYLEQLKEAIAKIDAKIKELELKYSASQSKTERRTLRRQAEDLYVERKELEAKIAEREDV